MSMAPSGGWCAIFAPLCNAYLASCKIALVGLTGEGQYIDICPDHDLVLVRMGRTDSDHSEELKAWRTRVLETFAGA